MAYGEWLSVDGRTISSHQPSAIRHAKRLSAALQQLHSLFRSDAPGGEVVQYPAALFVADARGGRRLVLPHFVAHGSDDLVQPGAQSRIGKTHLLFHAVELAFAANEDFGKG